MTRALLAVSLACALSGCPKPDPYQLALLTSEQALSRTLNVAARHTRLSGVVKAKLPGIQGVVASVDLDVALEPPSHVSVAVRSFFEQPMQVLVTDGREVTIFDGTQGAPVFMRGPATERALGKVLPIPLRPIELVEVMLARPPADARGRLMGVDEERGTYDLWLEAFDHGPMLLTVRASDDAVVRWRQHKKDGRPVLDCEYADLRVVGEVAVAHAWTLTRLDVDERAEVDRTVRVTATDVVWNGPPLPPEAFVLEPPPGVPIRPL